MIFHKKFLILILPVLVALSISSCSTVSGMGKDIQKAGQVIEQEADKNKRK